MIHVALETSRRLGPDGAAIYFLSHHLLLIVIAGKGSENGRKTCRFPKRGMLGTGDHYRAGTRRMSKLLILFQSTHAVIRAERLCMKAGIPCKVIAVPRELSSECGIAIELEKDKEAAAAGLLSKHKITFSLHRV